MGLKPVTKTFSKSIIHPDFTQQQDGGFDAHLSNHSLSFLSQPCPLSTGVQLQYARNGHAVLRSILPPFYLHQLQQDLVQYSTRSQLQAYQQKVEVVTKSSSIASSCKTIEECIQILSPHSSSRLPFLQYFNGYPFREIISRFFIS